MSKVIYSFAFLLMTFLSLKAQEFQGIAVYQSKTSTAELSARMKQNKDISPDRQKMAEEMMKKEFEKTFILTFNKTESIYKEEEKLDSPMQGMGGMRMMMAAVMGGGPVYKNAKTKMYTTSNEVFGKEFLVKDSLPKINWQMSGETKQVGGYNCFKATAVMPASRSDFRNFRLKKDEPKKDQPKDADKKTNFMDGVEMPKEITVTAWYTPDIPVNQGPEKYSGLPGLILEVNDGKTIILCSKIILNPKEKAEIKEPANGETVTQKQYDEIVVRKMEEMRQRFQGRGQGQGQHRIGG